MMQNCPKCSARLFIRYYPKVTEIIWARCPDCRHGWKQEVQGGIVAEHDPFRLGKAEKFLRNKINKTKHITTKEKTAFEEMLPDNIQIKDDLVYFKDNGHQGNFLQEKAWVKKHHR
jgi:hypothetical protein